MSYIYQVPRLDQRASVRQFPLSDQPTFQGGPSARTITYKTALAMDSIFLQRPQSVLFTPLVAAVPGTFEDDSFSINGMIPVEPMITIWQ